MGTESSIEVRTLKADDWPVIRRLFGDNGACGGCWCMWWRVPRGGKLWEEAKGGKNPRPGRVLTDDDIDHYQKIVVALSETIRIMADIDEVIEEHGGWPGAFQTARAMDALEMTK